MKRDEREWCFACEKLVAVAYEFDDPPTCSECGSDELEMQDTYLCTTTTTTLGGISKT